MSTTVQQQNILYDIVFIVDAQSDTNGRRLFDASLSLIAGLVRMWDIDGDQFRVAMVQSGRLPIVEFYLSDHIGDKSALQRDINGTLNIQSVDDRHVSLAIEKAIEFMFSTTKVRLEKISCKSIDYYVVRFCTDRMPCVCCVFSIQITPPISNTTRFDIAVSICS